jgi:hypothetical protein
MPAEVHEGVQESHGRGNEIIEVFRAPGELEKRREIVSDLLVHHAQSSRDGKAVATEYRDVRLVNGKAEDAANARPASHSERLSQVAG